MTTNVFEERHRALVQADYGKILDAVLKALRSQERVFEVSSQGRFRANVSEVAEKVSGRSLPSPLVGPGREARSATVNFREEFRSAFPLKVRAVRDALQAALEDAARERGKPVSEVIEGLGCPLQDLQTDGDQRPGFGYAFPGNEGVTRRRLSLQEKGEPGGRSSLSLHRLTVEIDASRFEENLLRWLENHVEQRFADEESPTTRSKPYSNTLAFPGRHTRIRTRTFEGAGLGLGARDCKARVLGVLPGLPLAKHHEDWPRKGRARAPERPHRRELLGKPYRGDPTSEKPLGPKVREQLPKVDPRYAEDTGVRRGLLAYDFPGMAP